MVDRSGELYNSFECMDFSEDLQKSINDLALYMVDSYVEISEKGGEINETGTDLPKRFFGYALKLIFSGIYPETFEVLIQNYYESAIIKLLGDDDIESIRIRMLLVLQCSKLLHSGNKEQFLEVVNQFSSNRIFNISFYRGLLL